jgi:Tol biopolymer transport system component
MTLAVGTRLGPYEIIAPLGAGGMGEVYRARDTRLAREVAIKVLPPHLADTAEARSRFEREAKAISSLNHPHICTLHDVGREGDRDYLVMELVEGETLAQRLTRGPLTVDETMRLGVEIADALDKAHRQGLVHRDLKPGNVMLTRSGAKLLDFGLARSTGLGPVTNLTSTPTVTRALTAEGAIVGTFQYMSPEQLEGREADARSDVWALGVVLYESLTGRKAFEGTSQAKLIGSIMNSEPPPVSTVSPLVPPALDRLLRSCLAKDANERVQTAHDVKLQLQWILEGGSQIGVPGPVAARRKHRDRAVLAVAVVSTAALLLLGGWMTLKPSPRPRIVRFEIQPPGSLQFQDAPRVSPDGRYIAYNATDSLGVSKVWLRPLEALQAQPLAGTDGALRPFWSPDSRFLAFMAGGKLKKIGIDGAPPIVICDAPTGADGTWSGRGVILFDGRTTDPIRRVPAAGGIATDQVLPDTAHAGEQVGWPEFLPDGRHFLYLALGQQSHLRVGSLDSKESKDLGPCESQIKYVSPGYLLFSRGGALVAQRFDTRGLKLIGDPVPIAEQVTAGINGASEFHASENGVLVFSASAAQAARMVEMDRSGKQLRTFTLPDGILNLALSPDGRRVAMRALDPQSRTRDVWIDEPGRDIGTRFTYDPGNENYPLWAPDGRSVLYWSDAAQGSGLFVKDLTGAGQVRQVLSWKENEAEGTDWSRDGKFVLFTVAGAKHTTIYLLSMTDHKASAFLSGPFDVGYGTLSPDGRYIAYCSNESGRNEVYVQPFPDRSDKWRISNKSGIEPSWSADGKQMYYLAADQRLMSVPIRTTPSFEPGEPQPLFPLMVAVPDNGRNHYVASGDDQRFIAIVPAGARSLPSTYVVLNWTEAFSRR